MTLLEIHEPGQTPLPHADEAGHAVGIDLGTTNSVVAIARAGKPEALRDGHGQALIPSVVAWLEDGSVLVGDAARERLQTDAANVVSSVKRLMGRGKADLAHVAGVATDVIDPASGETGMVKLRAGGRARARRTGRPRR